jgi:hypothetical protein
LCTPSKLRSYYCKLSSHPCGAPSSEGSLRRELATLGECPKLNFYKFVKTRRKPIDNPEKLWHNTDVAETDERKSVNLSKGFPEATEEPRYYMFFKQCGALVPLFVSTVIEK